MSQGAVIRKKTRANNEKQHSTDTHTQRIMNLFVR